MRMRKRRLRAFSLAIHDFNRAVRVAQPHVKPFAIFEKLCAEKAKIQLAANKGLLFALSGAWWVWSSNGALSLSVKPFDLSVPTAYVNVMVALVFAGVCLGFLSAAVIEAMIGQVSKRHLKIDAPNPLVAMFDGNGAWWQFLNRPYRFLLSGRGHRRAGYLVLLMLFMAPILIICIIFFAVVSVGISELRSGGLFSLVGAATMVAWFFLAMPFVITALMFKKYDLEKNVGFIRWNFLATRHVKAGTLHPMANRWLDERSKLPSAVKK
jgi:hypothetical protein